MFHTLVIIKLLNVCIIQLKHKWSGFLCRFSYIKTATSIYEQFILHNPLSAYKCASETDTQCSVLTTSGLADIPFSCSKNENCKNETALLMRQRTEHVVVSDALPLLVQLLGGRALSKIPSNAPMRSERRLGHTTMRSWYLTGAAQRTCATQGCTDCWRYIFHQKKMMVLYFVEAIVFSYFVKKYS